MKSIFILFLFLIGSNLSQAQDKEGAKKLVIEGVELHDARDYKGAIKVYNKALKMDKNNFYALSEKAMTLNALQEYQKSVDCAIQAIKENKGNQYLNSVYVTAGNSYDALNKPERAIEMYDEGLKLFPDFQQLHFNKGITLSMMNKPNESLDCMYTSAYLNPGHGGTQNAIARLNDLYEKMIPSIMAYARFIIVETTSSRTKGNFENLQKLMVGGVEKTGKNEYTIPLDLNMEVDENGDPVKKENDFSMVEMMFSLSSALDNEGDKKKETDVERFTRKFDGLIGSLETNIGKNSGFYWEYYAPYFIALKVEGHMDAFVNVVFASTADKDVMKWLESNQSGLKDFFAWSDDFEFVKK